MIVRPLARRSAARLRPAFTLLEVLVVMAILLILAGTATFATMGYLERAKVGKAKTQMAKIAQAVETYMIDNEQNQPENLGVLTTTGADGSQARLPGGQAAITDPWGKPYQFAVQPDNTGTQRVVISTVDPNGQRIQWPDR